MKSLKEIVLEELGKDRVESVEYEGCDIVVYTRDIDLFVRGLEDIKRVVSKIKKRVFVRLDNKLLKPEREAELIIKEILPKELGLKKIYFDRLRSIVYIELLYPEKLDVSLINKIKLKTGWFPIIKRAPRMESKVTDAIRTIMYQSSEYRKKFLDKLGEKIYTLWTKSRDYFIRLSFLGAAKEVGRSAILLQTKSSNVLLDVGVNVAFKDERAYPRFDAPEFNVSNIDAIVISHAHLDHVGSLPILFKYGYRGPVYVTEPTLDLMVTLLLDYIDVLQREGLNPPFTSKEVREVIKHTIPLKFFQVTDILPDVRLTFYPAGHVLGAAMIHLNIGEGSHNILYTGDFKFSRTKLHDPAYYKFERLETLVMESTYGGNNDRYPPREEVYKNFIEIVKKTIENGGKVLIPVLGLGRAQEIMVLLDEAWRNNLLPKDIEVYVEGMIWDICSIYTTYPEYLSKEFKELFFKEGYNPFESEIFHRVANDRDREEVLEKREPYIVLATSGMMTGGPILEYFRHLAIDEKNSLVFVSYQAKGTLGRYIQEKKKQNQPLEVLLETKRGEQEIIKVNMKVFTVEGLSGHSDRNELENFLKRIHPKPKKVFLVHGEANKMKEFKQYIIKKLSIKTVTPNLLDALRVYP